MPGDRYPRFRAAAVQAAPVFLDRDATIDKAVHLIEDAARQGAELVVFPEVWVPAYPVWTLVYAPMDNHDFFRRLFDQSVKVPSPATEQLAAAARRAGVYVSIGINEKSDLSMGAIWNSNLLFDRQGRLIHHHRKLVPTFAEKLAWANGDGTGLRVVDTELGRLGVLLCGENTNPLARYALLAQGEQVHLSTWPPLFPFKRPGAAQNYDLRQATLIRTAAHSVEGKVFTIVAAGVWDAAATDIVAGERADIREVLERTPQPVSMILNPNGELLAQLAPGEEGFAMAEIDLGESILYKQIHDIVGYYNRFDIFELRLHRAPQRPITIVEPLAGAVGAAPALDHDTALGSPAESPRGAPAP
jgi:nitrilase